MLRKKRIGALFIILILFCTFTGVCVAADIFKIPRLFSLTKDEETSNAVFEMNGEILHYDSEQNEITIISTGGKYTPLLSPDNTKILYRKSVFEIENGALIFGVIDLKGNSISEIKIDTEFSNEILDYMWISESLVGVTTHVNPSTSEYFVYEIFEQKLINSFVGNSFTTIPGTKLVMYEKNVPHWSEESVKHSYIIENEVVYTSDSVDMLLGVPVFSDDMTKIAFIETPNNVRNNYDGDNAMPRLVVCEFDKSSLSVQKRNSINIDSQISGYVAFNDRNEICIVNATDIYWYNEDTDSFVQESVITNLRDGATDSGRYTKLQEAVKTLCGDDSLDNLHSINWISK